MGKPTKGWHPYTRGNDPHPWVCGCGFLVGVGVGWGLDTHGYTHADHYPWVHTSCNWHYYSNPGCSHFRRGFFTLFFSAWFGIDRRYLLVGADQYHLMYFHMNFCSVCLAKFLWLAACWPINVSSVLSSPPWDSRSTDLCSIITTIL